LCQEGINRSHCQILSEKPLQLIKRYVKEKMKKYMVVENYKKGCYERIYERYHSKGRMFPEGLQFLNSWVNKENNKCFQLMETNDIKLFFKWFEHWKDLVDFELYRIRIDCESD
jgi:hypothetical protein